MAAADSTCSIDACDNPVHCRGWCKQHYGRVKNSGSPYRPCEGCGEDLPLGTNGRTKRCSNCRICTVDGCNNEIRRNRVCNSHWSRVVRNGNVDVSCRNCGKPVPFDGFKDDQGAIAHYCSAECRTYCSISGCGRTAVANGVCHKHWKRISLTGSAYRNCGGCGNHLPDSAPISQRYCADSCKPTCKAEGCPDVVDSNGYCARHSFLVGRLGYLPDLNFNCVHCGKHVTRSYADRQQTYNRLTCDECTVKQHRDHEWYRQEVLDGLTPAECGICGEGIDLTLKWPDPGALTIDHIVPITKGGTNHRRNLQPACWGCNSQKRNRIAPPIEGVLTLF